VLIGELNNDCRWWSKLCCWELLYVFCTACVCASHDDGSIGCACSWRGDVKDPCGVGSQHLATTNLICLFEKEKHIREYWRLVN
jgi:hypothetical protein